MKMYSLGYFASGHKGICQNDFTNSKVIDINLDFILSITRPELFTTPLTDKPIAYYSIVTMYNSDKYYITESEYERLIKYIKS
jgi:hypothetical protein